MRSLQSSSSCRSPTTDAYNTNNYTGNSHLLPLLSLSFSQAKLLPLCPGVQLWHWQCSASRGSYQQYVNFCYTTMSARSLTFCSYSSDCYLGSVYDDGCNQVDGLTTSKNPCTEGIFGCSPPPVTFNRYTSTFTGTHVRYSFISTTSDRLTTACMIATTAVPTPTRECVEVTPSLSA